MSDDGYINDKYSGYNNEYDTDNIKDDENTECNEENETTDNGEDASNGNSDEKNTSNNEYYWCGDIPFGFQTINPQVFNVIGEIVGDVMSNRLPYNVQNAVGNWLQLVGQIIESYSSQQNYFQSGPGRYYNLKYYNVTNPFCPNDGETSESSNSTSDDDESTSNSENCTEKSDNDEIDDIKSVLKQIQESIVTINEKINKLENDK